MFNKRIAGIVAGTALAASASIVPQAAAQDQVQTADGTWGHLETINTQQDGDVTVFVPSGKQIVPLSEKSPEECFTHNGQTGAKNYNAQQVLGSEVTIDDETYRQVSDLCSTGDYTPPVIPDPDLPGDEDDDENGSSDAAGSALLGLSALAGSALLSSGGSSAIPDGDGSGPGSSDEDAPAPAPGDDSKGPAQGPVDSPDSKATGQQPATGPVGGQDPKAVAQAQAANAPAAAPAKAAPAAQQAAPAPTAQQQLANTGVQGTLIALAAGLAAIAAGALLVLRRRA